MAAGTATTPQEMNREKQRKFKGGLKDKGLRRVSFIVNEETYSKIKEISAFSGISQGEVVNRMLDIRGGNMMEQLEKITKENVKTEEDPFHFQDFSLQEHSIEIVSRLLGFSTTKLLAERRKTFPDKQILDELEQRCATLAAEQRRIYFGEKELMQRVINEYEPEVNRILADRASKINEHLS